MIKALNNAVSQLRAKTLKAKQIPEECNLNSSQLTLIRLQNLERLVFDNEQRMEALNAKSKARGL